MPRFRSHTPGLLLAAIFTLCLMAWLATSQTEAVGLWQDSPISPNQQPTETATATATETATEIATEIATATATPVSGVLPPDTPIPDTPTDTPVPDAPTPEPPTDTPVPDTPTSEPPTDTPIPDTPTPSIPTDTPTVTPTPEPTIRPVVLPTATLEPTLFDVAGQVIDVTLSSAVWIWLTCGSLVFFAVAGAIAGFSFYRQSRQRFDLYEVVSEEDTEPSSGRRGSRGAQPPEDDTWPSSLP